MPARERESCKSLCIKNVTVGVIVIAVGVVLQCLTHAVAVSGYYVFAVLVMFIYYNFREIKEGIISCCLYTSGYYDEPYRPDDDDAPQEEPEVPNYARREEPEVPDDAQQEEHEVRNSTGPTDQEEVVDVPPAYNDVISSETSLPSYTEALDNITV